jgi:hypothetical protein
VINGIEVSRHAEGRVYVVANDYRNGDFGNYVYRTTDDGRTWTRVDGALPAKRVARTLREDLVNPNLLFLGTELGLFWSNDGGTSWAELRGGMPLMAHNDLFIHPREHDLVLGTHSRGIWILDNIAALREVTPAVAAMPAHVFTTRPAEQIRYRNALGHVGDVFYRGENPAAGGLIDIWLKAADSLTVTFHDARGAEVARVRQRGVAGINRVVWDLRYADGGPLVHLGTYEVRVASGSARATGRLEVREDPRITVSAEVRRAWTESLRGLATLRNEARALNQRAQATLRALPETVTGARRTAAEELARETAELASRTQRLYGDAQREVAPLTGIQREQEAYYRRMLAVLSGG